MENNNTLNLDALAPSRQPLIFNALAGHSIELSKGKFSESSLESLSKVGLTSIEVTALEQGNATTDGEQSLKIPDNPIPSSENNPFSREKWNPDMQRQLHETEPLLAQKLFSEANS